MIEAMVRAEPEVLEALRARNGIDVQYGALGDDGHWESRSNVKNVLQTLEMMGFDKPGEDDLSNQEVHDITKMAAASKGWRDDGELDIDVVLSVMEANPGLKMKLDDREEA